MTKMQENVRQLHPIHHILTQERKDVVVGSTRNGLRRQRMEGGTIQEINFFLPVPECCAFSNFISSGAIQCLERCQNLVIYAYFPSVYYITSQILSGGHATLKLTESVGRSVGWSVRPSVCQSFDLRGFLQLRRSVYDLVSP